MEFFELLTAMKGKAPVVTVIVEPTYSRAVVGTVVGLTHRVDQNEREIVQVEIKQRNTNSIVIVAPDKVEPLWEGAKLDG